MIELPKSSIVKTYPVSLGVCLRFATATLAFALITFLLTGSTEETRMALPVQEETIPVYSEAPDEEIDYEELLNRIPLHKPAPKPPWLDWSSENKRPQDFV